jgi:hypothetical protein
MAPRQVTSAALVAAIQAAWSADTSADVAWSAGCPSLGQCAVTALVVQDYAGGRIIRAEVGSISHYWNLIGGRHIDLTKDQFRYYHTANAAFRTRGYILSFPDTARRYNTLRERVSAILGYETAWAGHTD